MKTLASLLGLTTLAFLAANFSARAADKVIVHEWGTFTCLQDEQGNAIGGINVDDEPVPPFVYGLGHVHNLSGSTYGHGTFGLPPYSTFSKGWNPADSDVTMRLETPVLYIYPPKGQTPQSIPPLDVHVDFHSGVLSQYYPYADGNGFPNGFRTIFTVHIRDLTTGLTWKGVRLGSADAPVETSDSVWTTPREVGAPILEVKGPIYQGGEVTYVPQAEHFLFYRGIGQLYSPLRVQDGDGSIGVWPQNGWSDNVTYADAWLVNIRADGACGFRAIGKMEPKSSWRPQSLATASETFAENDMKPENLGALRSSMHDALVKEGLYDDEATAMLKTWELSYFKSPGLRFFYIVPRAWTDKVLPLKITGAPTEITRVMVGRIELISETQKATLARLAKGPCPDIQALKEQAEQVIQKSNWTDAEKLVYYMDDQALSKLCIPIPSLVEDYLSLGRFRDPLIVHEQRLHPSPVLAQFIKDNRLAPGE